MNVYILLYELIDFFSADRVIAPMIKILFNLVILQQTREMFWCMDFQSIIYNDKLLWFDLIIIYFLFI